MSIIKTGEENDKERLRFKEMAERFVHARKGLSDAKILASFVAGSTMYNLAREGISDEDFHGVYQMSTNQALSLRQPTLTVCGGGSVDKELLPDYSFHEIGKYITLLLKGNPTCMEALFVSKEYVVYTTPEFEELRKLRKLLLTQRLVSSYIGFLSKQISNLQKKRDLVGEGSEVNIKPMYHAFRLLYECKRVIAGEEPIVWFPPGQERDLIMDIRKGKIPLDSLLDLATNHLEKLRVLRTTSTIPENAPEEPFNELLLRIRKKL